MRGTVPGDPDVGPPLLLTLKALIERSYGMPPVIRDVAPFIVGDAGYRRLYGTDAAALPGARLMVREGGASLRAALYYPDVLVRHLERHDPIRGLGDANIEAFAVLVEELDHLLTVASRAAEGRPVSLLELEHHALVTKYLVVLHFLGKQSGRRRLPDSLRLWARHHLFERYAPGEGEEERRYSAAVRLARRFLDRLESLPPADRPAELRTYQRRPFSETCRLLLMNPN